MVGLGSFDKRLEKPDPFMLGFAALCRLFSQQAPLLGQDSCQKAQTGVVGGAVRLGVFHIEVSDWIECCWTSVHLMPRHLTYFR